MNRKITISIFVAMFCSCVSTVFAQHQLSGVVKDRTDGSYLQYATAALLRSDSTVVTGVITDDSGRFVIDNVTPGNYLLQVSFIGYKGEYMQVNVPAQSDLGEMSLGEDANLLSEVVVTGRRALVEQRIDRLVVNVRGNMITSGRNVNDLLKQMPGLVVDENGNAKLNGREATVYVDGRPTRLPAEQVAQMLTGMMGDVVDRVELIDNPSSRYEAGMSSAIVNIRLRRDASLGLNGTVQAGVGFTEHDFDFASLGGLNLNYRSKKLNVFGNYGYNNATFYQELSQIRNYGGTSPSTYDQYSLIKQKDPSHTLRAGIDWFVASGQTIGALFNGTYNNRDIDVVSQAAISQTGVSKTDSTILSDTWQKSSYTSQMYNLNYRLDADKNGVLTADLDYGRVHSQQRQDLQSRYLNVDGGELRSPTEFQYSGPRDIDIFSFKADYTKPFSENSNLEAGVKTGQTVTDNEIVYENMFDGRWEFDPTQSNRFKYTEQVSAAYVTYNRRFGKLSAMAGLRAEYTFIEGESPTVDTTFSRSYLDWFPSAYLQYQISETQALNLSYSRKITRPGYGLLNPFRMYADPFTFSSGNPDLNPAYRNTAALSYNISGYLASLSYSALSDIFEQDYVQDDVNRTMGLVQLNVGKREQYAFGVNVPLQAAKWYGLNLYSETTYTISDTRHSGYPFRKNYLSANAFLNHNFTFSPSFRAQMQMMWIKPTYSGIIQLDDIWGIDARMEKTFLDDRLSLSLSCDDILSTMGNTNGKMKFGNINQTIKQDVSQRRIMLTVRYSFGSQQIRVARNRNVGIEEEMGRAR
jgi:hypothetical protein